MSRIVYVNGDYFPETEARISVFDRGFLMADGVYEVTTVVGGRLIDFAGHMARLARSLRELRMTPPASEADLLAIHRDLIARNGLDEGLVYLQVTRGGSDRDFAFPPEGTRPTLVLFTQSRAVLANPAAARGLHVVSLPDLRWGRCDIKTVQLLYSSLAKMEALGRGADDAWLVDADGVVTEGSSNNAYILTGDRRIVTRRGSPDILSGITRAAVVRLAEKDGLLIDESGFTLDQAKGAAEAFTTSASGFVCPVVAIDGTPIGSGQPGPVARRLRDIYIAHAQETAI